MSDTIAARRARDSERYEPAHGRCPRCRAEFAPGCYWERLQAPEGREAAWRCRHLRGDGTWCVAHSGPAVELAPAENGGDRE